MKRIIPFLILAISLFSFNNPENQTDKKLSEAQLKFIMENYLWNSEDKIIINFRQPQSSCHYDNYENLKQSSEWFSEFYSNLDLENVRNIFVYSESDKSKEVIDSKNHFPDIENFYLENFFIEDKTCFGILVINKNGYVQKKSGEYIQKDILNLLKKLNKS